MISSNPVVNPFITKYIFYYPVWIFFWTFFLFPVRPSALISENKSLLTLLPFNIVSFLPFVSHKPKPCMMHSFWQHLKTLYKRFTYLVDPEKIQAPASIDTTETRQTVASNPNHVLQTDSGCFFWGGGGCLWFLLSVYITSNVFWLMSWPWSYVHRASGECKIYISNQVCFHDWIFILDCAVYVVCVWNSWMFFW